MGQAKNRGSFEDRKTQAIARDKAEFERKDALHKAWKAEQEAKQDKAEKNVVKPKAMSPMMAVAAMAMGLR